MQIRYDGKVVRSDVIRTMAPIHKGLMQQPAMLPDQTACTCEYCHSSRSQSPTNRALLPEGYTPPDSMQVRSGELD
jgi:hypothetical protein